MSSSDDDFSINEEDQAVWQAYIEEEALVEEENFADLLEKEGDLSPESIEKQIISAPLSPTQHKVEGSKKDLSDSQLDRRTEEKLRKGKMKIERRLDLHGLNKAQAHEKLNIFIEESYQRNLRCVLVITGKGKTNSTSDDWLTPSKGILKENVPIWLGMNPCKNFVLKFFLAQPKDGGSGALYVYLRRHK